MKIKEFIFVYPKEISLGGICSSILQNQILDEVNNGYELYGTTFYCHTRKLMCQAMVKYEEDPKSEITQDGLFGHRSYTFICNECNHKNKALLPTFVPERKERKLVDISVTFYADETSRFMSAEKFIADRWELFRQEASKDSEMNGGWLIPYKLIMVKYE